MRLLIVRHGECKANVMGVVAGGRDDSPLTAKGLRDAQLIVDNLGAFSGRIMSSPMRRTLETATYIRDILSPGAPIILEPAFIERDVGDATGMPLEEYFALEQSGAEILHAETETALFGRVKKGLAKLRKSNQAVLLVTHTGTYRMIECVLQGLPPHAFAALPGLEYGEVKAFDI